MRSSLPSSTISIIKILGYLIGGRNGLLFFSAQRLPSSSFAHVSMQGFAGGYGTLGIAQLSNSKFPSTQVSPVVLRIITSRVYKGPCK